MLLNEHAKSKNWSKRDIVRAHRVAPNSKGERPIVAKFHHGEDKITALAARSDFKESGIGIGNDLTRRQRETIAKLRKDGKIGYFKKGKLFIVNKTTETQEGAANSPLPTRDTHTQDKDTTESVISRPRTRSQVTGRQNMAQHT